MVNLNPKMEKFYLESQQHFLYAYFEYLLFLRKTIGFKETHKFVFNPFLEFWFLFIVHIYSFAKKFLFVFILLKKNHLISDSIFDRFDLVFLLKLKLI